MWADETMQIGRRAFLKGGALLLAAGPAGVMAAGEQANKGSKALRVGLITDLHYADKPPGGSRHYRETPRKLAEAAGQFGQSQPDFVVELGDFIDAADSVEKELTWLKTINKAYSGICEDRHYVLGNHCVDTLRKEEFLEAVERERSYYSFDRAGYHFVVVDSCFRSDGQPYGRKNFTWTDANVPQQELDWLAEDLKQSERPTIVFAHQRLDVSNSHGVRNCPAVRDVLEQSGKVRAVFQGHSHQNDYREIGGIHYCTLVAMVEGGGEESNGYSVMDLQTDGTIAISGFRKQNDYRWPAG
ncbi:Calcineurin-like phosphoesterase superfamily domain protein [Maioricimonas rarisocia]|uniref:Calcineurin-like phosphoesterase superfamily domain protein n=1 Tax=Maioricimonas rarisocia TaxID=2528026 RepID=A0A517Z4W1_9PLAN|nr:metallophosphoesterase [Maioricimonas rarisocia]QDU37531.1 Calcineurin-like phosphoesterase superfamily domain protein [Maioricimonas rarisocia]